ncbi:NADPH-dependent glutamate synthase beta chain [Pseudobutyrivibrio sp. UC1225]|nr:FAD-dependent oxidoreductase [Pseudobutyrivibrio sp. UC1225]SFN63545.1 NADPH-dependent glutamate synthase beta chain [Pseudobutyrivibrio sp. UC1225]
MPEMSKAVIPPHMNDKAPSKKIIELGRKITDVAGHKMFGVKVEDPEYWGLAEIVTEEMAEVGLTMKLRHHYTFDEMCKMNPEKAKDKEAFQKLLDEMSYIGLLEYDYGDHYDHNGRTAEPSERRYCLPMFVPGSAELFNMEESVPGERSNNRLKEHPALASFFERMTFMPLDGLTHLIPPGGAGVGMHVIPVEKAIEFENEKLDLEQISYWLKKYEGHIGVGQCSCRVSRACLEEGCGDDEMNWCIGLGDFADYCRETGKGHDITYEEAMRIVERAETLGYVHQITNIDGENKIFGLCNCNVNICNALRTSQLFNTPNMSRSAYTAHVEAEKCVACGKCVEYCPAGAVKLGQKLCKKDGTQVEYPKVVLPDKVHWGKEKYDENYRDNNRKNCYETGTAPCKVACPAHVSVQGYVNMAKEGRYEDALALIKKDNPFPAICGRVCNKRCEAACTRGTIDAPVAIDDIKKFIAERDLHAETRYIPPIDIASNRLTQWDDKIAIIGSGPAGLSCAYYLATKGYKPTVFEKNNRPGGMLTWGIPSWKLEKDVVEAEIDVIRQLGVEIKCGVEVGKDITLDELRAQGYKAFYVAIGCQGGKIPPIPGTDAKSGIDIAVTFLHKATEDQNQKMDGNVVVVGGGNVAIDCVRTAARFGAGKPQMFCLEQRDEMPANNIEITETLKEDIAINNGWGPKEILKDAEGNVAGIVFKKCTSVKDAEGKFNPQYDENDTMTVECKNIIFAIGQGIEWGGLLGDGKEKVEFWHGNYPVADHLTYQTAQPDIFVGGDVYSGPKFAIDAIEAGKCAADSLHRFVQPGCSMTIGKNRRDFIELDKDNILVEEYDTAGRNEPAIDTSIDMKHSFRDAHLTLTEEQVKAEASRCLKCGASVVDENKCIGCGVCTTKCAFDAIHLHRTHPECTHMVPAEDKFKHIGAYALKRAAKVAFSKKSEAEKQAEREHKEYKRNRK